MEEFELRRIMYDTINEICHYSQMQVFATSVYQKNYFQLQIDEAMNEMIDILLMKQEPSSIHSQSQSIPEAESSKEITMEELLASDGRNGKPAYVAVNGNVYDVSRAIRWAGGTHFGLYAGHDLTEEFMTCHNAMLKILNILPVVGVLKKQEEQ